MRQHQLGQKVLNAATANGIGKVLTVAEYKHVMAMVTVTTVFTTGKLTFLGSINEIDNVPTFVGGFASASKTNQVAQLGMQRVKDNTIVDGATGLDLTIAGTYLVRLNVDGMTFCTAELSSITGAGEVTVTMSGYAED